MSSYIKLQKEDNDSKRAGSDKKEVNTDLEAYYIFLRS